MYTNEFSCLISLLILSSDIASQQTATVDKLPESKLTKSVINVL